MLGTFPENKDKTCGRRRPDRRTCYSRNAADFLRCDEANPVVQRVNSHQCTSFLHLAIQRFDLKTRSFINEFRIQRFAFSELFAEEITFILAALVGVSGYERGEGTYE